MRDTRYDYLSANIGYGTSPDDRDNLLPFEERLTLNSYKFGVRYNKILMNKFIVGLHTGMSRDEYFIDKFQTEIDFSIQLQYIL